MKKEGEGRRGQGGGGPLRAVLSTVQRSLSRARGNSRAPGPSRGLRAAVLHIERPRLPLAVVGRGGKGIERRSRASGVETSCFGRRGGEGERRPWRGRVLRPARMVGSLCVPLPWPVVFFLQSTRHTARSPPLLVTSPPHHPQLGQLQICRAKVSKKRSAVARVPLDSGQTRCVRRQQPVGRQSNHLGHLRFRVVPRLGQ